MIATPKPTIAAAHDWIDRSSGLTGAFMTQVTPVLDSEALNAFEGFERATYRTARPDQMWGNGDRLCPP